MARGGGLALFPFFFFNGGNIIDLKNYLFFRKKGKLRYFVFEFRKLTNLKILFKIKFCVKMKNHSKHYRLYGDDASIMLAVNYETNYNMAFKGAPKYLDISKCLNLVQKDTKDNIFSVDVFPYLQSEEFLGLSNIDFNRHSIVFGASGTGKSKFLAMFIDNIKRMVIAGEKYKIVVIDPHASLIGDIGGLSKIVNFEGAINSINLFINNSQDVVLSVELLLDIFKGLISNYNAKLERVLRYGLYLLLVVEEFNFGNLRKLLNDLEYRNKIVRDNSYKIPDNVVTYFSSEFSEMRTKSYMDAIAPIISFIDEMEMLPVFNSLGNSSNLEDTIDDNFLTLFSLNRVKLGEKVTKTIASLVMQQLFILIQKHKYDEHIVFIIDEVATIENGILNRFLAEARKYNLSVVLAGQYFNGITDGLKRAIFASVVNYYMFRLSQEDASVLANNLSMKVPLDNTIEEKVKIITELQNRECLIRVSSGGQLMPVMKCKTLDFKAKPGKVVDNTSFSKEDKQVACSSRRTFNMNTSVSLKEILIKNSCNRGSVNNG